MYYFSIISRSSWAILIFQTLIYLSENTKNLLIVSHSGNEPDIFGVIFILKLFLSHKKCGVDCDLFINIICSVNGHNVINTRKVWQIRVDGLWSVC